MRDSNSRPLGPKPSTLAIWANPRLHKLTCEWFYSNLIFKIKRFYSLWKNIIYSYSQMQIKLKIFLIIKQQKNQSQIKKLPNNGKPIYNTKFYFHKICFCSGVKISSSIRKLSSFASSLSTSSVMLSNQPI